VTLATRLSKMFKGTSGLSLKTRMPNLKSVALTVFELSAFNDQKFKGSRDPGHAPFSKIFTVLCPECPWKRARKI